MKNQFVLALSTVIVTASLFSCAPKDEKLQSAAGGSVTVQSLNIEGNKLESARFLAVSLDRAFAGLSLVKSVLNPQYAASQKTSVVADKFETDILDISTGFYLDGTQSGQFSGRINYAIEKLEKDQEGKITLLVLKSENMKLETKHFVESSSKGAFVTSNNMNDRLVITKGARERSYLLTIEKTEELGLAKNTTAFVNTQIKLEFSWDGSSEMLNEAVKVTALRINARMHGARSGALTIKDVSPVLEVKLDSCISATGELRIVKDAKTQIGQKPTVLPETLVKIEDSTVTIDGVTSRALACATRPQADLTRYLR
ncbi:MAG: hypothetical protein V4654_01420 [Bdellovibrionota bacterium]